MFIAAAHVVAEQVTQTELDSELIYPPQSTILETEYAAQRVAEVIFKRDLARVPEPLDVGAFIQSRRFRPKYQLLI
jgi:malate dehydrogenase (oxaloacetate-decarboxylating)(NADP+)